MAKVTAADKIYDLGSGDGKIVIAAAKRFGATAVGIEYDADLVKHARCLAAAEGVADRVTFVQGDIFESDFSDATVVALYLTAAAEPAAACRRCSRMQAGDAHRVVLVRRSATGSRTSQSTRSATARRSSVRRSGRCRGALDVPSSERWRELRRRARADLPKARRRRGRRAVAGSLERRRRSTSRSGAGRVTDVAYHAARVGRTIGIIGTVARGGTAARVRAEPEIERPRSQCTELDLAPLCPTAAAALLAAWPFGGALAQDLEPRLYTNVPVGMNFLGAGYGYSEGNVLFDPAVAFENAADRGRRPVARLRPVDRARPVLGQGRRRDRAVSVSTAPRITKASASRATSAASPTRARV